MKRLPVLLLSLLLSAACREEAGLKLEGGKRVIAIQGIITDKDATQWVRITWSSVDQSYDGVTDVYPDMVTEGISNAKVFLSKSTGYEEYPMHLDSSRYLMDDTGKHYLGYYTIDNFKVTPGKRCGLMIMVDNQIITAEESLNAAPEIDSVTWKTSRKLESSSFWNYTYTTTVHFRDNPSEKNYYLITTTEPDGIPKPGEEEHFIVLDDSYIADGIASPELPSTSTYGTEQDAVTFEISIYSISEKAYTFYKSINRQQQSDGGLFKPLPYLPRGNFSGMTPAPLGFFLVAGVNTSRIVIHN